MTILLALLAATSAPGASPQTVWKWRPGNINCILRQDVGQGRFLDVGTRPGSNNISIRIVDTDARTRQSKPISGIKLVLAPGGLLTRDGFIEANKDPIGRTAYIFLTSGDLSALTGTTAIEASHADFGSYSIAVQSIDAAVDAIRTCDDRRMSEWGVDPAMWRALAASPIPATPAVKWFSWTDYPDRQKIYKDDIEVVARLDVAADGSVSKCTVVNRPPEEFVPAACNALMRNASFQPARDAKGQAVAAPYLFHVSFAAYRL